MSSLLNFIHSSTCLFLLSFAEVIPSKKHFLRTHGVPGLAQKRQRRHASWSSGDGFQNSWLVIWGQSFKSLEFNTYSFFKKHVGIGRRLCFKNSLLRANFLSYSVFSKRDFSSSPLSGCDTTFKLLFGK